MRYKDNWESCLYMIKCGVYYHQIYHRRFFVSLKANGKITDSELNVDNFNLFRADHNRHGGGVLIYCHHSLKPRRINIDIKSIEFVCIKIASAFGRYVNICCVYRLQICVANWTGIFYSLVNILASDSAPCIILG